MANTTAKKAPKKKRTTVKYKTSSNDTTSNGGSGSIMTILNVAASMKVHLKKDSLERKKLSFFTGIKGKSTIANALTKLKAKGWFVVTPTEITITDQGMKHADQKALANCHVPKTNREYWETLKQQYKLKATACRILDFLGQEDVSRTSQEIANNVNDGKKNSTVANALTELKKAGCVTIGKGRVRMTDEMFPNEPRPSE